MKKYKLPGCFYLDIWPFGDSMLIVMDPDVSRAASELAWAEDLTWSRSPNNSQCNIRL